MVFSRWSFIGLTPAVYFSAVMLRNLLILLACSSALALKPSSQPALQPASMQKRFHTLLHSPSRSALAETFFMVHIRQALALDICERCMEC